MAVQGIPAYVLRNRLILLHHFSELFCPCIPMFDLEQTFAGVGAGSVSQSDLLRAFLVSTAKVPRDETFRLWPGVKLHRILLVFCQYRSSFYMAA